MAIIAPPLPRSIPRIKKLDGNLRNTLQDTLLKIRERGEYSRELSNLSDAEFLNADEDGLEQYGIIRLNSNGRGLVADLNPAPSWDGGYHIRSHCHYPANAKVTDDFETFGGAENLNDGSNQGYLNLMGTDVNPAGIRLPSYNAGLDLELTMVIEKVGSRVPAINFRRNFSSEQRINLNTTLGGATTLATIDGSWVTNERPDINTRTTTQGQRSDGFFVLKVGLRLGFYNGFSFDGSLIIIENSSTMLGNNLRDIRTLGTFGGRFDPRDEKINNLDQQRPGDYMISPSISNCRLYYIDCLVGRQSNRIKQ